MVPVEKEPDFDPRDPIERCCICREPTQFWTKLLDRLPGAQVACCEPCARYAAPSEIPSKHSWCGRERVLRERGIR